MTVVHVDAFGIIRLSFALVVWHIGYVRACLACRSGCFELQDGNAEVYLIVTDSNVVRTDKARHQGGPLVLHPEKR